MAKPYQRVELDQESKQSILAVRSIISRAQETLRQVLNDPRKELEDNAQEAVRKIEAQTDLARDEE